jgi:acetyl-CoA carboxylase beta subunit
LEQARNESLNVRDNKARNILYSQTLMPPTESDLQVIMLETTLSASTLLKKLLDKQSISSEEKNAAEIALKFLELTALASRGT